MSVRQAGVQKPSISSQVRLAQAGRAASWLSPRVQSVDPPAFLLERSARKAVDCAHRGSNLTRLARTLFMAATSRGIGLKLLATLAFALMNALIKSLAELPVGEIVF